MKAVVLGSGERVMEDSLYGYVQGKAVILNIRISLTGGQHLIFSDGWEFQHLVGVIDGDNYQVTAMEKGWFRTTILIRANGVPMTLKTGNEFGAFLRGIFGSDAYE